MSTSLPPSIHTSLHHSLTDPLITETNGLELICPNGATLANIPPPYVQPHLPSSPPAISPFIRPFSQYAYPSAQPSIVASKASQTPHTHTDTHTSRDGEADRPGKQTSHSPMVHLMFHDLTASDTHTLTLTHRQHESRTT